MAVISLTDEADNYVALNAGDVILGLGGADVLTATIGGNKLYGGDGSDTLNGGIGDDYLQGDDLNNFNGHNVLNGFGGDDYILSNSSLDEVDAGSGNDTVEVWKMERGQVFKGGAGQDHLTLYAQQISVYRLDFSAAFTAMEGITAQHARFTGFESLQFIGGEFLYNILASELDDTIIINNLGSQTFVAGSLEGRGGNDSFIINGLTESGTETVDGGTGTDRLSWNQGTLAVTNLTIDAAAGTMSDDVGQFLSFQSIEALIVSASNILGHFAFQGSANSDSVSFGGITASVRTGGGDDSIIVGATNATVNAGAGNDVVNVATDAGARVSIAAGNGDDTVTIGSGDTASGDAGNDTLRTVHNRGSLFGGVGDDTLSRQASFIDELTSASVLDGGADIDTAVLTFNIVNKTLRADFSQALVTLYDGSKVRNCEIVKYSGGLGTDIITSSNYAGGAAFNIVDGGFGDDRLTAAAAGATLNGGMGNNVMIGGIGNDILTAGIGGTNKFFGGGGHDRITGGTGIDEIRGGAGLDRFVCGSLPLLGATDARDTIFDFSQVQKDRIDLSLTDANSTTIGINDAFTFRGAAAFSGTAGELRFERVNNAGTTNDYTLVTGDVDGNGTADFVIELTGLITLRAIDFVL